MEDIEGEGNEKGIHLEPLGHWDIINMTEPFKTIATIPPEAESATRIRKEVEKLGTQGELLDKLVRESRVETPQMGPIGDCILSTASAVDFARLGSGKFDDKAFVLHLTYDLTRSLAEVLVRREEQVYHGRKKAYCDCFEKELESVLGVVKEEFDFFTRAGQWDERLERELKHWRKFVSDLEENK